MTRIELGSLGGMMLKLISESGYISATFDAFIAVVAFCREAIEHLLSRNRPLIPSNCYRAGSSGSTRRNEWLIDDVSIVDYLILLSLPAT